MIQSRVQAACQASLHDQQTIVTGWAFMQTVGCISTKVNSVKNYRERDARRAVPILPPAFDELTLINYVLRKSCADEREIGVSINGAECVTQPCPSNALHPVETVESLYNARASCARLS